MTEILLLAALILMGRFGFILMGKVDAFFESCASEEEEDTSAYTESREETDMDPECGNYYMIPINRSKKA